MSIMTPSYKRGTAKNLEEAHHILGQTSLPCGVWPTSIRMDVRDEFVAHTIEEFDRLCKLAIGLSPDHQVEIMEVETMEDLTGRIISTFDNFVN